MLPSDGILMARPGRDHTCPGPPVYKGLICGSCDDFSPDALSFSVLMLVLYPVIAIANAICARVCCVFACTAGA